MQGPLCVVNQPHLCTPWKDDGACHGLSHPVLPNRDCGGYPPTLIMLRPLPMFLPSFSMGESGFRSIGTEGSTGTKVFALTGTITNVGLVEVPMGTTLRTLVYDIGGGVPNKRKFKSAQMGGPSGGCVPENLLDTPIDFDSLTQAGAMMGSGGVVIMDERTCMVDTAKVFYRFFGRRVLREVCSLPGRA